MQFHDYVSRKPKWFRGTTMEYLSSLMKTPSHGVIGHKQTLWSSMEIGWYRAGRPFYNVYPIAIELCRKTSLNMKWGDLVFPTRYLLLRFPAGSEPLGTKAALLRVPSSDKCKNEIDMHMSRFPAARQLKAVPLGGIILNKNHGDGAWVYERPDIRDVEVRDTVAAACSPRANPYFSDGLWESDPDGVIDFLTRMVVFIGLLARGNDLITPAILSKDRDEYDATSDEARKRWLEDRAARRQGRGFDIGRSLEIERASSPHWRCPHLALFHTGPGGATPVLKIRSGCVVIPKDMSRVPTGYLGEEKEGEEHKELPAVFRTSIPSRMRFHALRRDNYRCRLCGMTADDGVTLECDHIIAVAKGGKTEPTNLWTLCRPCNNGKSDSDLHLALEENKAMEKARKEVKCGI